MQFLKNISIKRKLVVIIFCVSMFATLIAIVIDMYAQYRKIEENLINNTLLNAKLIAEYSVSPLDFGDPRGGKEVLEKIDLIPNIVSAYLFDQNDNLFASYINKNYFEKIIPKVQKKQSIEYDSELIKINQPVYFKGKRYGTVIIKTSTDIITQQLASYSMLSLIVLILAGIISLVLATKLQTYISDPILNLANVTREISKKGDYSLRVEKESNDEIGLLYDEFNEMIEQLQINEYERDKVEDALKANEYRLKKAQEISKVGSWIWDPVVKKMIWSEEMYRIFGIKEIEGLDLLYIFNNSIIPEDYSELKKINSDDIKQQSSNFSEYRIIRADGAIRYLRAGGDYFTDMYESHAKMGVVQDITIQKEIDLQIISSKQRFEGIFNSAPVAIFEEDYSNLKHLFKRLRDNGIDNIEDYFDLYPEILLEAIKNIQEVDINTASVYLFEAANKEDLIRNIKKLFVAETFLVLRRMIESLFYGNSKFESETIFETFKGNKIDVILRMTTFDNDIMKDRMLISIIDITDLKKLDKEREKLLSEITQKNAELEQIIYVSSHDLRSPLVNIQGFGRELELNIEEIESVLSEESNLEIARTKLEDILKVEVPASLKFIRSSAIKMDSLLKGLLRISRLGRAATKIEDIDMNNLMNKIIDSMQFQIQQAKVDLTVENLPNCMGDNVQVNQLFTNILDNAIKYLSPKRQGIIKISATKNSYSVVYVIEDNGIGIHPEQRDKIFEIFHRLNPESIVQGEGLGLAIVKRILQKHNGKIWVDSKEDEGCKFFIELPGA